jgi:hypothetical protein
MIEDGILVGKDDVSSLRSRRARIVVSSVRILRWAFDPTPPPAGCE